MIISGLVSSYFFLLYEHLMNVTIPHHRVNSVHLLFLHMQFYIDNMLYSFGCKTVYSYRLYHKWRFTNQD